MLLLTMNYSNPQRKNHYFPNRQELSLSPPSVKIQSIHLKNIVVIAPFIQVFIRLVLQQYNHG